MKIRPQAVFNKSLAEFDSKIFDKIQTAMSDLTAWFTKKETQAPEEIHALAKLDHAKAAKYDIKTLKKAI